MPRCAPLRLAAVCACVLALASCGSRRPPVSARPASADGGFDIPFVKYTLDNGLDVVLHEDHSDPIVALATLVHVGSNRERRGRTGFAHFFEHMSFNDSENVPRGANRKMIGELGGTRNGGTSADSTVYYEVVPKDAFEKLLWIDSDRLGFMINTVSEWALENEKQVVKNEKRQGMDNRPYGHTRAVIPSLLYPPDHPYHWPVIGSLEDLQAANLQDVREFYDRWYGANNATLVIAGDIDVPATRQLVERWFGEIRRGPEVTPLPPRPAVLSETRSVFHEDSFATLPELRLTFPTVEQYHRDAYALDVLARVLSEGKRAPLYQVLVEERQLCPTVEAWSDTDELAGTFNVRVRANAGVDLDATMAALDAAFARFDERGFTEAELGRIRARQETGFYGQVQGVLDKAFQLATYNEFAGDPGFGRVEVERIRGVTRDDVLAVWRRYVRGRPHVATSFVPRGSPELALEGAARAEVQEEPIVPGAEPVVERDEDFEHPRTPTRFDRSEPPLGPPFAVEPPRVWSADAANGMRLLGIEHDELPLVEFRILLHGGHLLDPPGRAGAAELVAAMLEQGTRRRTPQELEDAIGDLGGSIEVDASHEGIELAAEGLARNFRALFDLAVEMLLEPRWDPAEFERLKSAQLQRARQREGDPEAIADAVFERLLYGDAHPFAQPVGGTVESIERLTLVELQRFWAASFSPSVAAVQVVGNVSREGVRAAAAGLDRWEARSVAFPPTTTAAAPERPVVYFVDVPGAKQSVLRAGVLALRGADAAYNDLTWAQDRLGAGSSARLFQVLRVQKGYTYGAGSGVPRRREIAPFSAESSVRANVTLEALSIVRDQLREYRGTYTGTDLETTQNLLIKQSAQRFETLEDLLDVLEAISRFDLPLDYVERDRRELGALTLAATHATIERYIDEGRMIYLVVGDGATQRERLERLGYGPPVALDVHGNPLGAHSE